jgi:hypothetical protein
MTFVVSNTSGTSDATGIWPGLDFAPSPVNLDRVCTLGVHTSSGALSLECDALYALGACVALVNTNTSSRIVALDSADTNALLEWRGRRHSCEQSEDC